MFLCSIDIVDDSLIEYLENRLSRLQPSSNNSNNNNHNNHNNNSNNNSNSSRNACLSEEQALNAIDSIYHHLTILNRDAIDDMVSAESKNLIDKLGINNGSFYMLVCIIYIHTTQNLRI